MTQQNENEVPQENAHGEGEAPRLHLNVAGDVYQICFAFFENVSEIFVSAAAGEVPAEEAESRMANVSEWLTEALLGGIPGIEAAEGWTGAPLARNLVAVMSSDIARLPKQAQEALSSVDGVVMFAAMHFMHEVQETVSRINQVPEEDSEKAIEMQGRAIHELCVKWTDRFIGKGKPDIIMPGSF